MFKQLLSHIWVRVTALSMVFTSDISITIMTYASAVSTWWLVNPFVLVKDKSLVHTSDISIRTRSIRKQSMISPLGLAKIKQPEIFFVLSFIRLLDYAWTVILCLRFRRFLCRRFDFIPSFYLLFCLYAYAYAHLWTRLYAIKSYDSLQRFYVCEIFSEVPVQGIWRRNLSNLVPVDGPIFQILAGSSSSDVAVNFTLSLFKIGSHCQYNFGVNFVLLLLRMTEFKFYLRNRSISWIKYKI